MQIHLNKLIPTPLLEMPIDKSEIWNKEITIEQTKSYQIIAPSGKGKTSLISILYGLRSDYSGNILFDKQEIKNFSKKQWVEIRKSKLSIVPQGLWIFDELTAIENILLKNRLSNHLKTSQIETMLELTGMLEHKHKPAKILSYGQKQRIAIIRALSQPFEILLLDEAFSHLDKENTDIVWDLIQSESVKQNASILLTSLGNETFNTNKTLIL